MSTLKVTNIKSNGAGFNDVVSFQNSGGTENGTLCRTFVNFNGTGTVAIRASFNVSSITDNGVGQYAVNFTTALADVNYCPVHMGEIGRTSTFLTTSFSFQTLNDAGSGTDVTSVNVAIFR